MSKASSRLYTQGKACRQLKGKMRASGHRGSVVASRASMTLYRKNGMARRRGSKVQTKGG